MGSSLAGCERCPSKSEFLASQSITENDGQRVQLNSVSFLPPSQSYWRYKQTLNGEIRFFADESISCISTADLPSFGGPYRWNQFQKDIIRVNVYGPTNPVPTDPLSDITKDFSHQISSIECEPNCCKDGVYQPKLNRTTLKIGGILWEETQRIWYHRNDGNYGRCLKNACFESDPVVFFTHSLNENVAGGPTLISISLFPTSRQQRRNKVRPFEMHDEILKMLETISWTENVKTVEANRDKAKFKS